MTQARLYEPNTVTRNGMARAKIRESIPEWVFSPMTARRAVLLCGVFAAAALMGGCQVLGDAGSWAERQMDAGWRGTKTLVKQASARLPLRSAPTDVAVFHHTDTHDAGLNTKALERAVWIAQLNHTESVSLEAIDRTMDNGVMVFRPGHGSRRIETPRAYTRPVVRQPVVRQPYGAAPIMQRPAPVRAPVRASVQFPVQTPARNEPVSYVKLDGSLDMADWTGCEQQVGGAFLVSPTSTRIAPDFDACMRSRGYIDEREAEERLAGGLSR